LLAKPTQLNINLSSDRFAMFNKERDISIATTVTITDGKLSAVALDVAGVDDPALPKFARAAWLRMNRATVLRVLGMPAENHLRHCDGMNVEQMIFERPGEPDVSIFLIDGRVAAKRVGRRFPADVLAFALPLAPDPPGG
jgi:hypothetical protein